MWSSWKSAEKHVYFMGIAICVEEMQNELFIDPVSPNEALLACWFAGLGIFSLSKILFLKIQITSLLAKVYQSLTKGMTSWACNNMRHHFMILGVLILEKPETKYHVIHTIIFLHTSQPFVYNEFYFLPNLLFTQI